MKKKKIILISAIGVLAVAAAVITAVAVKNHTKKSSVRSKKDSSEDIVISVDEPDADDTEDLDAIIEEGTAIRPDETEADRIIEEKKTTKKRSADIPVVKPPAPTEKKYVKDADPQTGVSWDGVSKIIYRTSNGETTEKTYGGYYEIRPDVWVLLEYPTEKENHANKCPVCGRISGDGRNGTCVRYSLIDDDMICENCGETIPAKTCHTCK